MQNIFCLCKTKNHNTVQGLCLNENCDIPLFCSTCVQTNHQHHQKDCQSLESILQSFKSHLFSFQEFNHQLQQIQGNAEKVQKSVIPFLTQEIEKLKEQGAPSQLNNDQRLIHLKKNALMVMNMSMKISGNKLADILKQLKELLQAFQMLPQRIVNEQLLNTTDIIELNQTRLQSNKTDKAFSLYNQSFHFEAAQERGFSIQSVNTIYSVSSTKFNPISSINHGDFNRYPNMAQRNEQFLFNSSSSQQSNKIQYLLLEIDEIDQKIKADPENPEIYIQKANTLLKSNQQKEASNILLQASQIAFHNIKFEICHRIGNILMTIGCFQAAFQCFDQARIIETENSQIYKDCGKALIQSNQNELAIQYFEQSLLLEKQDMESQSNNFSDLLQKGKNLLQQNQYIQALQQFDIVINMNPGHAEALQNKRKCLAFLQQIQESMVLQRNSINLNPQNQQHKQGGFTINIFIECFQQAINFQSQLPQLLPIYFNSKK